MTQRKTEEPTIQQKIQALSFCIAATTDAHDASHTTEAGQCTCAYGSSIRIVKLIRKTLYAQISESRKAKKAAEEVSR